jgi:hypothetical protein
MNKRSLITQCSVGLHKKGRTAVSVPRQQNTRDRQPVEQRSFPTSGSNRSTLGSAVVTKMNRENT